jgi:hypothetical protein
MKTCVNAVITRSTSMNTAFTTAVTPSSDAFKKKRQARTRCSMYRPTTNILSVSEVSSQNKKIRTHRGC